MISLSTLLSCRAVNQQYGRDLTFACSYFPLKFDVIVRATTGTTHQDLNAQKGGNRGSNMREDIGKRRIVEFIKILVENKTWMLRNGNGLHNFSQYLIKTQQGFNIPKWKLEDYKIEQVQ